MEKLVLSVPDAISFERAIALTETLLDQMEDGQMSDAEVADIVAQLVRTDNGARGLFVTYLPDPRPLADNPSPEFVIALRSSPDIVAELMVKNLVMSTAMVIYNQRRQFIPQAKESQRVQSRSAHLLQQLGLPQVQQRADKLLESLTTGEGEYEAFLTRWGYDDEQKQVMAETLRATIAGVPPQA